MTEELLKDMEGCFNSQPRKEADAGLSGCYRINRCFNSQPRKEADGKAIMTLNSDSGFNSQPRKEADITAGVNLIFQLAFQLTASQGG